MKPDQWERLKTLFVDALDQPAATRHDWLHQQTIGDEMLAREAAALLLAHETAEGFLETPPTIDPDEFAAADDEVVGTRLGQYVIEYEVDQGGQGRIYCARDTRLGRRVALKALPVIHETDAALRERLRREAQAAATISHPAVATVYALEEIDGRLFIASEFIEGQNLRQELNRGRIEPTRALSIASDIARALCAAHDAGIVHRDLKPENVLITAAGAVKVVDFGIAHLENVNTRLTRTGHAVGTPAYMAPEQIVGGKVDARIDVYALGVVLTEMLTGKHPLEPGRPAMPASVSEIAWRCIQTDPKDRYQTARQLLEALDLALEQPQTSGNIAARWWWEFHQAAVAVVYAAMLWPTWLARGVIGGREGNAVFVTLLAAAIVAVTLRLHLWFTSRFYPAELAWARARARRWLLASDALVAATLVVAGALIGDAQPGLAALEIAVGIAAASAFALVEPATTRAAFEPSDRL